MKNKENNFVSAVLYIHNNEQTVKQFIEKLNDVFSDNFKKYEIVCVNDCSEDKSAEIIRKTAKTADEGAVVLMNTGFYQGLESSMVAGVDFASGDFVFEFDSIIVDYDINLIMDVYSRCISGCDIVGASSDAKQRKTSRVFYHLFNNYSKTQYKIQSESFRILSRRAINRINQMSITIPYRKAIYANCGLKYDIITYDAEFSAMPTHAVKSSYRQGLAFDSFIIFTNIAYRISLLLTALMMAFLVFAGIYTLVIYIGGEPVEGWTTTMILLTAGFLGMFGVLSIVIKYLSVIVNLIFRKTKYVIGNIEKL